MATKFNQQSNEGNHLSDGFFSSHPIAITNHRRHQHLGYRLA